MHHAVIVIIYCKIYVQSTGQPEPCYLELTLRLDIYCRSFTV